MEVIVGKTNSDSIEKMSEEITNIARKVELIINVGEEENYYDNIAHSISLRESGNAIFVETMDDLYLNYIRRFRKVGIMAGKKASKDTIEEIVKLLENTQTEGYIYERFK